jgi:DNA-binding SARP family transcriptional activator/energy-coupling factor transporter ATP-binding protein EcfA2
VRFAKQEERFICLILTRRRKGDSMPVKQRRSAKAVLEVKLLGGFDLSFEGEAVDLNSRPAQALLAYLLLSAGTQHRRERLAALLWPDADEDSARQNLRNNLWKLNKTLGEGFIKADKVSVGMSDSSAYRLDVDQLENADESSSDSLINAVSVYKGELLPGFYEEWVMLERERLQAIFDSKMQLLLDLLLRENRWRDLISWGEKWIALGHIPEPAYRALMTAHARLGDLAATAATYQRCVKMLQDELGVEPSAETKALYQELLRAEKTTATNEANVSSTKQSATTSKLPAFLEQSNPTAAQRETFIGRERELGQLHGFLEQSLTGKGQVVFVTGEAGQGKSSLLKAFSRQAAETHPELVVTFGSGSAYTGVGDPFLPFRDVVAMLTGELESSWKAGQLSREQALRLWQLLPQTLKVLLEQSPELVDTFVPRDVLTKQIENVTGFEEFRSLLQRPTAPHGERDRLLEAYTKLLITLSQEHPLLIILDDLHWADASSISLLFHLARRIETGRILLLGAYRPEDISQGHPLENILSELKRYYGDIVIDLDKPTEARHFVDALLDQELNHLSDNFREALTHLTDGHPLFTVELLKELKTKGQLEQDEEGYWVESASLDWQALPARVEGVIRTRVSRLDKTLEEALTIGSVEGETFTAELVAQVVNLDERQLVRQLSQEALKQQHFIEELGVQRVGAKRLSRFRFRHNIFQRYLYNSLGQADRAYLHEAVGNGLETLYGESLGNIAVPLARHYSRAGLAEKAVPYLFMAGKQAARLTANVEAEAHFREALALLDELPETNERISQELELTLALGSSLQAMRGYADSEVRMLFERGHDLAKHLGETTQLARVLWSLWAHAAQHEPLAKALEFAHELLALANQTGDEPLLLEAYHTLWYTTFCMGEFETSYQHAMKGLGLYSSERHRHHAEIYGGHDPGTCAHVFAGQALWHLGFPDKALEHSLQGLHLAESLAHTQTQAQVSVYATATYLLRREGEAAQRLAETTIALTTRHGFLQWQACAQMQLGHALILQGAVDEGIAHALRWRELYQNLGGRGRLPLFVAGLAEGYKRKGETLQALTVLEEVITLAEQNGEQDALAELYRLKGECLLEDSSKQSEGEVWLQTALELAGIQKAKSLELRAAMSLARANKHKSGVAEVRTLLSTIYGSFTEGFDTADLQEARRLLET